MSLGSKIPATIVTGFLGAGKTTLIRSLLTNVQDRRIALIVNEFGDLGFDGDMLKACGNPKCGEDDIVELTNGCICCTVADDFLPTIEKLLDRDEAPEHIIIETSGLALPQPLVRAFSWPTIKTRVTVDGVVTVVDAAALAEGRVAVDEEAVAKQRAEDEALDHESPIEELFEDQLTCADLVVVNKSDLVSPEVLEGLRSRLDGETRSSVRIVTSHKGTLSPSVVLGIEAGAEDDIAVRLSHHEQHHHDHDDDYHDDDDHHHHHHDHDHDEFETFIVRPGNKNDPANMKARVEKAMGLPGVLRIKGLVKVDGKAAPLVVQAVGARVETYFDRVVEQREPHLVVIGLRGLDRSAIQATLAA
ncbi:cobalamin biosynthesis protein CobW [Coralliovum pocilloporae]|uniref:cobalamin biosynthesis protein CobW n=1 Tax=Coralliovum pocilloporae TaxID=3066369 RepID=UPI003306F554